MNERTDNISRPMAWLMALLFTGGILLAGSDFVGFPWGQVIGVGMLVALVIISNWAIK